MKLVESELPAPGREPDPVGTPPRPERRRVSVSLLLTASVLVGTVVTVYSVFPARDNLLLTRALELHDEPPPFQLERPTRAELGAWATAVFDRNGPDLPWPTWDGARAEILGAARIAILRRPVAVVRYRVYLTEDRPSGSSDGQAADTPLAVELTVLMQGARDAPPRAHDRSDGGHRVLSWRSGRWTLVAVGPDSTSQHWLAPLRGR
ncbi:MAG: hypothetical protein AAGC55_04645 [Myxococcota bacterium]